jgi:predicted nuclease of predicted toxin-antitoxin system
MKLLLDENISRRIIPSLQNIYLGSSHVSLLELNNSNDLDIWKYAKNEGYTTVTHDADFHEFSLLTDGPPLVIWLRCGNQTKNIILDKLLSHQSQIEEAEQNYDIWCIEIY